MTPDLEAWKEIGKDAAKALGGGLVVAMFRKRRRREPEHECVSKSAFDDLRRDFEAHLDGFAKTGDRVTRLEERFIALIERMDRRDEEAGPERQVLLSTIERVGTNLGTQLGALTQRVDHVFENLGKA